MFNVRFKPKTYFPTSYFLVVVKYVCKRKTFSFLPNDMKLVTLPSTECCVVSQLKFQTQASISQTQRYNILLRSFSYFNPQSIVRPGGFSLLARFLHKYKCSAKNFTFSYIMLKPSTRLSSVRLFCACSYSSNSTFIIRHLHFCDCIIY